jgi:hypothetical protein
MDMPDGQGTGTRDWEEENGEQELNNRDGF